MNEINQGLKHVEKEIVDKTEFKGSDLQRGPDAEESAEGGRRKRNNSNRAETKARRMIDVTRDKPIKVTVRVLVPVRDHPKFNFVGKLLGPKGNSLKRLQESTMTKMAILGRGSMKNKLKEEELRRNGDPKFSHLHEDLHVEITAFAPAAEAHARIAWALTDVRRFLIPDYNDDIRQEQMWEMQELKKFPEGTMNGIDVEPAIGPTDARASSSLNYDSETCSLSGGSNCSNECRSSEIPRSVPRDRQTCRQLVASFGDVKTPSFPIVFSTSSLESLTRRKRQMVHSKHSSSPIKRSVLSILTKTGTVGAKQASLSHFTPS